MGASTFDAVKLGKVNGAGLMTPVLGDVSCHVQGTIAQNSTNNVDLALAIPVGSQILGFMVDVLTAFDSATSATLTIGQTAGGTEYIAGVNAKTGGRATLAPTAAQVTAYATGPATTGAVVARVAPVGATTAGLVRVIVAYIPPTT